MEEEKETDSKEVSDALHMLLHCALKDTEFETQKEQFEIVNAYIKQLEKDNEEWQRAYQEEKDKQFELLRENKRLEEENKKLIAQKTVINNKRKELEEELERFRTGKYISLKVNELYIPKSKVKEKIEELNKQIEEFKTNLVTATEEIEQEYWKSEMSKAIAKRNVLQELLR